MDGQEGIDFVRCRVCGLESCSLARHLAGHRMTAGTYKETYHGAMVVASKMADARAEKLRARPKKEQRLTCKYCGGKVAGRVQRYNHEKDEELRYLSGQEGVDYLVCRECGYRSPMLSQHIKLHGMDNAAYLAKHPGASLVLGSIVARQSVEKRAKGGYKPISEKRGAKQCAVCGTWYQPETAKNHLGQCVASHPDRYVEGRDYIKCPECGIALLNLGKHLIKEHGWSRDNIALEVGRGLALTASRIAEQRAKVIDFKTVQSRREATHLARHGFANPFSDPSVKAKILETNRRRYGVDHPMQNEEVFTRQTESAQRGPSGQEVFFDAHTPDNVVYCGYGGRFIRTKTGVHKCGRLIKDLNPDFIVLPSSVLKSALSASRECRKMDRIKHRSRYVVELLGDWYHSEKVIGVKPEEHERELVAAYKSAGIECLVLWEKDVMERWDVIRPMVEAWVGWAVADMNENPVFRRVRKVA